MPWPKKQVIQFDPGTDYRIFRGAIGLDRHLCSLSSLSCSRPTCIYFYPAKI